MCRCVLASKPRAAHLLGRGLRLGRRGWWVGVAWLLAAPPVTAQRIVRPKSVWGRVHDRPEGFGIGGVELLATLIVSLLAAALLATWLFFQAWRWRSRDTLSTGERKAVSAGFDRRERTLSRMVYGLAPAMGLAAMWLAPARLVLGLDIATWVVILTAATILFGAGALIVDHGSRRRLGL